MKRLGQDCGLRTIGRWQNRVPGRRNSICKGPAHVRSLDVSDSANSSLPVLLPPPLSPTPSTYKPWPPATPGPSFSMDTYPIKSSPMGQNSFLILQARLLPRGHCGCSSVTPFSRDEPARDKDRRGCSYTDLLVLLTRPLTNIPTRCITGGKVSGGSLEQRTHSWALQADWGGFPWLVTYVLCDHGQSLYVSESAIPL